MRAVDTGIIQIVSNLIQSPMFFRSICSLNYKKPVSVFRVKKGGVCVEGAHVIKKLVTRLSLSAQHMYPVFP